MKVAKRGSESQFLGWATAVVYGLVIIENAYAFLSIFMSSPTVCLLLFTALISLSWFLLRWLPHTGITAPRALLWTGVAAAAWPWTTYFFFLPPLLFLWPSGEGLAGWFGPFVPYAILVAVGLGKLRLKTTT
jgi:hypothetical protein